MMTAGFILVQKTFTMMFECLWIFFHLFSSFLLPLLPLLLTHSSSTDPVLGLVAGEAERELVPDITETEPATEALLQGEEQEEQHKEEEEVEEQDKEEVEEQDKEEVEELDK